MKCRVCGADDVSTNWLAVAWCDPCLTRGLELRREQPELDMVAVRNLVAAERGGAASGD